MGSSVSISISISTGITARQQNEIRVYKHVLEINLYRMCAAHLSHLDKPSLIVRFLLRLRNEDHVADY